MQLDRIFSLVEQLRKGAIGEPKWVEEKQVFEYQEQSAKVVAVLKLVRAAQGLTALVVLCRSGLFIDFGVSIRCVNDCNEEIYFLLEEFPKTSDSVDKFVKAFFENTIDGYLSAETPPVLRQKIRSAVVRVLKGGQDDKTQKLLERIYKAFCGYAHANYAHIMEIYNGGTRDFNLAGVPSEAQCEMRMQHVELAAGSVLHAAAFIAQKLELKELHGEFMKEISA